MPICLHEDHLLYYRKKQTMARRVFFSFHYDNDVWRANQVRNCNVVAGADVAGFFDRCEYEEAKKTKDEGIRRMILRHLEGTSVTVVLIGNQTAYRPWVKYEIEQSVARSNGLLGIQIHHLKNSSGLASLAGPRPAVPASLIFPIFAWDDDLECAGLKTGKE